MKIDNASPSDELLRATPRPYEDGMDQDRDHDGDLEENEYAERLRELYFDLERGGEAQKGTAYEKLLRFLLELPRSEGAPAPVGKGKSTV